jgi:hypothetical protein
MRRTTSRSRGWRDSALLSWLVFIAGVGLLGAVLWTRATQKGAWRFELEGQSLGQIGVMDPAGDSARIVHPATIYFFETGCAPCRAATERLNAFVAHRRAGGLPVYALTNSLRFTPDSARQFVAGVVPVRLRRTTRELKLIRELPLVVQTDARGRIARAYVGVAGDEALTLLNYPPAASPTERP